MAPALAVVLKRVKFSLRFNDISVHNQVHTKADDADVVERILRHLDQWDPQPDTLTPAGPDPPLPQGETLPLTYHPVPDIA
jgi:hypothetical protein